MSTLVLTVWCAPCKAERAARPGKLGEVRRWASGLVRWGVEDRRGQFPEMGGRENKIVAFDTLVHPGRSDYVPPDTLPTYCERHGNGRVSTHDVVGKSGKVDLTPMSATT